MTKDSSLKVFAFLMLALMFLKVSTLHLHCHEYGDADEIENCSLCDQAIECQNSECTLPQAVIIQAPLAIDEKAKPLIALSSIFLSNTSHSRFFGRPPPSRV